MPEELNVDEDGYEMLLQRIHKNRFGGVVFNENTMNNMSTVKLRDDDILLCSYAKSGCHWLWENLRCFRDGKIPEDTTEKEEMMMELKEIQEIDELSSPRILNNHAFFDDQPKDLLKGKTKLIFIYRNPKDIAVSFFHHHSRISKYQYKGQFCHYLKRFVKGNVSNNSWFEYMKQWEEGLAQNPQIPHIIVSYEELHKNPISERQRIASFMGRSYDDKFLAEVAAATSIDKMRETKGAATFKDTAGLPVWYRKGVVGDWKNHFTVSENEWFEKLVDDKLGDSKLFKFVYSLES